MISGGLLKDRNRVVQFIGVLLVVVGLKQFYSTASVNELRWILAPTTFLVEFISGKMFAFESHAGYMSSDHKFVIAASCAGLNFLLTLFLLLTVRRLWIRGSRNWAFIPGALAVAYVATLITNTIRIVIALWLHDSAFTLAGMNANAIHRVEGIVVYFTSLVLLYFLSEAFERMRQRDIPVSPLHIVRMSCLPLLVYYVTTLVMPLTNGAFRNEEFWWHALFVLVVPLCVLASLVGVTSLVSRKKACGI
ncbi:MAG: exosortase K [Blastocatellia bacterium]|nr:MAG: exosortase K [Blastocatellia bacterium]